jgi:predicted Zn finger-like uncharacterized protein
MLIVCPNCATSYDLDLANLSPNGRRVRCVRCRTVWRAEPSQADKLLAAAGAIGPGHGAESAEAKVDMETISRSADELASESLGTDEPVIGETMETASTATNGGDFESKFATETPDTAAEAGSGPAEVEAPSIAPTDFDEAKQPIDAAEGAIDDEPAEDVESFAARRQRRAAKRNAFRWPLTRLQTAMLALVLVDTILVGWRSDVVRALPQTASFYALLGLPVNLRGVTFDGVATSMEQHEGVPILVVEGNVFNDTRKAADVPRLKFVVRNAAREEIYSWTAVPARASLQPGEAVAFRSRLASPPTEARDLIIRFVNRRDMVAGTR